MDPKQSRSSLKRRERSILGTVSFLPPVVAGQTGSGASSNGNGLRKQRSEQVLEAQRNHRKRTSAYMVALEQEVLRLRTEKEHLHLAAADWRSFSLALLDSKGHFHSGQPSEFRLGPGGSIWVVPSSDEEDEAIQQQPSCSLQMPTVLYNPSQTGSQNDIEDALLQNFCLNIAATLELTERSSHGYTKHLIPLALKSRMVLSSLLAASASHVHIARAIKTAVGRSRYKSIALAGLQDAAANLEQADPQTVLLTLGTILGLLIDDLISGNKEFPMMLKLASFWTDSERFQRSESDHKETYAFFLEQIYSFKSLAYPLLQLDTMSLHKNSRARATQSPVYGDQSSLFEIFVLLESAVAQACFIYSVTAKRGTGRERPELVSSPREVDDLLDRLVTTVNKVPSPVLGENSLVWVYYLAASRSSRLDHGAFFASRLADLLRRLGHDDVKGFFSSRNLLGAST